MANIDRPMGFQPYPYVGRPDRLKKVAIELDYGTDIFIGDLLVAAAIGINQAAAAGIINGAAIRFLDNEGASIPFYDASSYTAGAGTQCWVVMCDDPDQQYMVQDDGSGTPALIDRGSNFDIKLTHGGNETSGISGMEIDYSTINVTAGLQVRIVDYVRTIDNAIGDYCKWIVEINQTQFAKAGVTGIAGI